mmetsp:Transcript_23739/g.71035  ORF Transcript_23739/g.71035 Transcript_23739/m.71035 type:complete len:436 (+) Transcript_23739:444-1751(+)
MKGKVRLGGCAGRSRHHTRHHLPDVDDGDGSALAARGAEGGELLLERRPERLHLLPRHRLLGRRQRAELWPAGERGGEGVDVEEGVAQRQRWAVLRLLLRGPRQRQRQRWAVLRLPLPLLLLLRRRAPVRRKRHRLVGRLVAEHVVLVAQRCGLDDGGEDGLDGEGCARLRAWLRAQEDWLAGRLEPERHAVLELLDQAEQGLELAKREGDRHAARGRVGHVCVQVLGRDGELGAEADVLLVVEADVVRVVAQGERVCAGAEGHLGESGREVVEAGEQRHRVCGEAVEARVGRVHCVDHRHLFEGEVELLAEPARALLLHAQVVFLSARHLDPDLAHARHGAEDGHQVLQVHLHRERSIGLEDKLGEEVGSEVELDEGGLRSVQRAQRHLPAGRLEVEVLSDAVEAREHARKDAQVVIDAELEREGVGGHGRESG